LAAASTKSRAQQHATGTAIAAAAAVTRDGGRGGSTRNGRAHQVARPSGVAYTEALVCQLDEEDAVAAVPHGRLAVRHLRGQPQVGLQGRVHRVLARELPVPARRVRVRDPRGVLAGIHQAVRVRARRLAARPPGRGRAVRVHQRRGPHERAAGRAPRQLHPHHQVLSCHLPPAQPLRAVPPGGLPVLPRPGGAEHGAAARRVHAGRVRPPAGIRARRDGGEGRVRGLEAPPVRQEREQPDRVGAGGRRVRAQALEGGAGGRGAARGGQRDAAVRHGAAFHERPHGRRLRADHQPRRRVQPQDAVRQAGDDAHAAGGARGGHQVREAQPQHLRLPRHGRPRRPPRRLARPLEHRAPGVRAQEHDLGHRRGRLHRQRHQGDAQQLRGAVQAQPPGDADEPRDHHPRRRPVRPLRHRVGARGRLARRPQRRARGDPLLPQERLLGEGRPGCHVQVVRDGRRGGVHLHEVGDHIPGDDPHRAVHLHGDRQGRAGVLHGAGQAHVRRQAAGQIPVPRAQHQRGPRTDQIRVLRQDRHAHREPDGVPVRQRARSRLQRHCRRRRRRRRRAFCDR
jgi:hypothetical protein